MILESTQILCTILHEHGIVAPYRPTHKKHPGVIWAGTSLANWTWLRTLTAELNREYQYRFNRQSAHQSFIVSKSLPLPPLPPIDITERPLIMPDKYKISGDPITSYRYFYAYEKKHLLNYTKRKKPYWLLEITSLGFQK